MASGEVKGRIHSTREGFDRGKKVEINSTLHGIFRHKKREGLRLPFLRSLVGYKLEFETYIATSSEGIYRRAVQFAG